MKRFILLSLLLLSLILLYRTIYAEKPIIEEQTASDLYVVVISSPVFVKEDNRKHIEIIREYDWNSEEAYKIMLCESGGNANSHNFNHKTRDNSYGLFQINLYGSLANTRPSAEWLKVPANNIDFAYDLYVKEGRRFGTTGGWRNCAKKHGIR
jgi:hypothetical protein